MGEHSRFAVEAMRAPRADYGFGGERGLVLGAMPSGCHERLDANDVHDAGEIVGEDVQRHLASDAR